MKNIPKLGIFKKYLKEILKEHSQEEIERVLMAGTLTTTPTIENVQDGYPKPWLFSKLLLSSLILFYGFVFIYNQFENIFLVPAIILTGSFAIPISTLMLFFEFNMRRNISIWTCIRFTLTGGLISLFISLVLYQNTASFEATSGEWFAAFIEEPSKLIALLLLTKNNKKYPYILNGLLLGAAVGTGFSVFESAGYAFSLGSNNIDSIVQIIQLRGVFSPISHIAWTAISGAALWDARRGNQVNFLLILKKEFYIPFSIVIFCHSIWNTGSRLPINLHLVLCGVISWFIINKLIKRGVLEIANEKK